MTGSWPCHWPACRCSTSQCGLTQTAAHCEESTEAVSLTHPCLLPPALLIALNVHLHSWDRKQGKILPRQPICIKHVLHNTVEGKAEVYATRHRKVSPCLLVQPTYITMNSTWPPIQLDFDQWIVHDSISDCTSIKLILGSLLGMLGLCLQEQPTYNTILTMLLPFWLSFGQGGGQYCLEHVGQHQLHGHERQCSISDVMLLMLPNRKWYDLSLDVDRASSARILAKLRYSLSHGRLNWPKKK